VSSLIVFRVNLPPDEASDIITFLQVSAACKILQICLLDELRIQLGKVYNVGVEETRNSLSNFLLISIVLHCEEADVDAINLAVEGVILGLQRNGPKEDVVEGVLQSMLKHHKNSLNSSSHWLFWILDSYKSFRVSQKSLCNMTSVDWLEKFCAMRSSDKLAILTQYVTVEEMKHAFSQIFDLNRFVALSLCPTQSVLAEASVCDNAAKLSEMTEVGFKEIACYSAPSKMDD